MISNAKKTLFLFLLSGTLMLAWGSDNNDQIKSASFHSSKSSPDTLVPFLLADQIDLSSIDAIVKAVYQTISFHEGEEPDWGRFRTLFFPKANLIRITQESVIEMDMEGFILSFTERIKKGVIRSFREAEISRKTDAFGGIAQVFSTYIKNVNPDDSDSSVRGINSIQLYFDGQRWWISSLIWEDEGPDNIIPQKYLH